MHMVEIERILVEAGNSVQLVVQVIIFLQDTCEGSAGIQGKRVEGEEGGPDHILGGSCLGNQTRRQDSGAVDGR